MTSRCKNSPSNTGPIASACPVHTAHKSSGQTNKVDSGAPTIYAELDYGIRCGRKPVVRRRVGPVSCHRAHRRSRFSPWTSRPVTRRGSSVRFTRTAGWAWRFSHHAGSSSPQSFMAMVTRPEPCSEKQGVVASASDVVGRVKNSNHHLGDSAFDDPLDARDLRDVPRRKGFE